MKYVSYGVLGTYIVMVFASYFMPTVFIRPLLFLIAFVLFIVNVLMVALEDTKARDIMISTGVFVLFNIFVYMSLIVGALL